MYELNYVEVVCIFFVILTLIIDPKKKRWCSIFSSFSKLLSLEPMVIFNWSGYPILRAIVVLIVIHRAIFFHLCRGSWWVHRYNQQIKRRLVSGFPKQIGLNHFYFIYHILYEWWIKVWLLVRQKIPHAHSVLSVTTRLVEN